MLEKSNAKAFKSISFVLLSIGLLLFCCYFAYEVGKDNGYNDGIRYYYRK